MADLNFWPKLKKPILALAPMAGFTDSVFRQIVKKFGADVVYSEMVSAAALYYNQRDLRQPSLELLNFSSRREKYFVAQIFGSDPEHFAVAARLITKKIKPHGLDINFGCPVGKVIKTGAGSDLMKDLPRSRQVIMAVLRNTHLPVSVKIRAASGSVTALDFLKNIADLPVAAVMIHGRSVSQGFVGKIDYQLIKEARLYFKGVILANGGINNLAQAQETLALSGADGLGLARGVLGRPWLFQEIKKNQEINFDLKKVAKLVTRQAKRVEKKWGPGRIVELRKHLPWYVQGFAGASHLRSQLVKAENAKMVQEIFYNSLRGEKEK